MEKLKVKNAIVSKQGKESKNFKQFLNLANQKKINIITVKAGNKIQIDKDFLMNILFPEEELINDNILNNNSIVAKLIYKIDNTQEFSMLLTGDVEEIAERKIIEKYKNCNKQYMNTLKADVLKIAHHRLKNIFNRGVSKTSKT